MTRLRQSTIGTLYCAAPPAGCGGRAHVLALGSGLCKACEQEQGETGMSEQDFDDEAEIDKINAEWGVEIARARVEERAATQARLEETVRTVNEKLQSVDALRAELAALRAELVQAKQERAAAYREGLLAAAQKCRQRAQEHNQFGYRDYTDEAENCFIAIIALAAQPEPKP